MNGKIKLESKVVGKELHCHCEVENLNNEIITDMLVSFVERLAKASPCEEEFLAMFGMKFIELLPDMD